MWQSPMGEGCAALLMAAAYSPACCGLGDITRLLHPAGRRLATAPREPRGHRPVSTLRSLVDSSTEDKVLLRGVYAVAACPDQRGLRRSPTAAAYGRGHPVRLMESLGTTILHPPSPTGGACGQGDWQTTALAVGAGLWRAGAKTRA